MWCRILSCDRYWPEWIARPGLTLDPNQNTCSILLIYEGFTINWRPNKRRWTVKNRSLHPTPEETELTNVTEKSRRNKKQKRSRNSDQLQPCMMSFWRQSRYPGRKLEQSWNYGFEIQHRAFVSPADVRAVPSERTRTSFHRPPPVWIVGRWENRTGSEFVSINYRSISSSSLIGVCAETQLDAFPQNTFFGRGTFFSDAYMVSWY